MRERVRLMVWATVALSVVTHFTMRVRCAHERNQWTYLLRDEGSLLLLEALDVLQEAHLHLLHESSALLPEGLELRLILRSLSPTPACSTTQFRNMSTHLNLALPSPLSQFAAS